MAHVHTVLYLPDMGLNYIIHHTPFLRTLVSWSHPNQRPQHIAPADRSSALPAQLHGALCGIGSHVHSHLHRLSPTLAAAPHCPRGPPIEQNLVEISLKIRFVLLLQPVSLNLMRAFFVFLWFSFPNTLKGLKKKLSARAQLVSLVWQMFNFMRASLTFG